MTLTLVPGSKLLHIRLFIGCLIPALSSFCSSFFSLIFFFFFFFCGAKPATGRKDLSISNNPFILYQVKFIAREVQVQEIYAYEPPFLKV